MLKDVLLNLTENIHNIGHNDSSVDAMIDSVSGMGHRIKHGHDMQGLIESYHLEGIEGIGLWLDHMAKDFTSPAGIPLPFAEAIYETTGMKMDTAIDWLTVNASDAIELGTQEAFLHYFKSNPKAYKTTLAVGTTIGIIDDNPLIVVINTLRLLKTTQKNGKSLPFLDKSLHFVNKTSSIASKVCIGTAVTNFSLAIVGVNVSELVEDTAEGIDFIESAYETTSIMSDVIDGVTTLGVGLLVSKGIKQIAKAVNHEEQREIEKNTKNLSMYKSLNFQLRNSAPPAIIGSLLSDMKNNGLYPNRHLFIGGKE